MPLSPRLLGALACLAFVSLGLPDGLLGVAWPSMRASFTLPLDALGALLAAFTTGYVTTSFGGGRLLARLGLGALLAASCFATGMSLLGYALAPSFGPVVALAVVAGFGAGGIDTGINTYAAARHGPGMLNWLHACYGVGAAGGPAIMTAVLAAALPWQRGYAIVAVGQLALAAAFVATRRAWEAPVVRGASVALDAGMSVPLDAGASVPLDTPAGATMAATLQLPVAWLGIGLFFVYTGLELATGTWTYTVLTEGRGIPVTTAGSWVTGYWIGLTGGRVLGALLLRRLPVGTVLRAAVLLLATGLAVFAARLSSATDLAALLLAGAAAGPIFPSLIATTPGRVGVAHAANAIGFQIAAAALGQALVPSLLGAVGRRHGLDALTFGLVVLAVVVVGLQRTLRSEPAPAECAGPVLGAALHQRTHGA